MPKDFDIYTYEFTGSDAGGRISTPALRRSIELSESFTGLEETVKRYDLLLLVKRVGKGAGFTPRMIELLDYYMAFTRDTDWEKGSRPIVYQSLSKTSLDLGVSERQIQKLEKQLFEAGALTWKDSGNHRRYGQRDPQSGKIIYAYGVDLTPLAFLRPVLEEYYHEKQLYDQAWLQTKRDISALRRQIKACMAALMEQGHKIQDYEVRYNGMNGQIRTHIDLEMLRELYDKHRELFDTLQKAAEQAQKSRERVDNESKETKNSSPKSEERLIHYKVTTQKQPINQNTDVLDSSESENCTSLPKGVVAICEDKSLPPEREEGRVASGSEHVSLKQALSLTSEPLRSYIPVTGKALSWADLIEAAYRRRKNLGISQKSWSYACNLVGRTGAALCVILTEKGRERKKDPVKYPAAYFNGMLEKAKHNELHIHASVFGLLEKEK
jgi:hypothetical protein